MVMRVTIVVLSRHSLIMSPCNANGRKTSLFISKHSLIPDVLIPVGEPFMIVVVILAVRKPEIAVLTFSFAK